MLNKNILILLLGWLVWLPANADNFLGVQPNAPRAADEAFYQRLADAFSEQLGYEIKYIYQKDWNEFRKSMFRNEYTILLLESHMAAWTSRDEMKGGVGHRIVSTSGNYKTFKVLANQDSSIDNLQSLLGRRVCSSHPSSLASVAFMNEVTDAVSPPLMMQVRGGAANILVRLNAGRCDAAVLESADWEQLEAENTHLKVIFTTEAFPGWTITTPRTQTPQDTQLMHDLFAEQQTPYDAVREVRQLLSQQDAGFTHKDEDYFEQYNILPGVVWGW